MTKVALILHGWPQSDLGDHPLFLHLRKTGYEVYVVDMFNSDIQFDPESVVQEVKKMNKDKIPNVIFGISVGGLLLPHLARMYPQSKLVFIASGPNLYPNIALFRTAINIMQKKMLFILASFLLRLPTKLFEYIYQKINPYQGEEQEKTEYLKDMIKNIRIIKGIPVQKEWEIVNFVSNVDNRELLRSLKNKSLIINGKHDLLMPQEAGELLHKYLVYSRLIITKGEHFNVFSQENLKDIDEFLKD